MTGADLTPTEGVEVIADVVATASAVEGVPPWVTYVGGIAGTLIVSPLVGVLVVYLRRRLGVPEDTSSPPTTPTPGSPSQPQPDEDEEEIEELRRALSDLLIELRQTKARATAAERQVETLQGLLETMAGRHRLPPP